MGKKPEPAGREERIDVEDVPPPEKEVSLLDPLDIDAQIRIEFLNITTSVQREIKISSKPGTPSSSAAPSGQPDRKQILYGITGAVNPGDLMALMGPSGAGKSSLLTILAGRAASKVKVVGEINYNGRELDESMRTRVGYVPQDDILYQNLTVYETLYFAAHLRLPSTMTKKEKNSQVEQVITALGLTRCRDTPLRNQGTVSGGERKRVSVAQEMLMVPSIIFLDEPTSGLDSTAALSLVQFLRKLAESGRSVVATIHQPNHRIFGNFEKLLLLSQGYQMYYGKVNCIVEWFEALGSTCPFGMNVAEYVTDVAACTKLDDESDEDPGAVRDTLVKGFGLWMNGSSAHIHNGVTKDDLAVAPMVFKTAQKATAEGDDDDSTSSGGSDGEGIPEKIKAGKMSMKPSASITNLSSISSTVHVNYSPGLTWFEQFCLLYQRAIAARRFDAVSVQKVGLIVGWALFAGYLWFGIGLNTTVTGANNLAGLLWLLSLYQNSQGILTSLFTFPPEMPIITKERASGMYSLSAYYISRCVSEIVLELRYPIIQTCIVYVLAFMRMEIMAFIYTLLTIALMTLTCQGVGQLLGAAARSVRTIQICSALGIQFSVMTSGFLTTLPVWAAWLKWISLMRYSYNILADIQFNGLYYEVVDPVSGDVVLDENGDPVLVGYIIALEGRIDRTDIPWLDAILLTLMAVLVRVGCFYVLNCRTAAPKLKPAAR